jgi:transcriptional regulator GlxA family with amidase domain
MKHVSLLIPRGHFSLVNVEGTHQIFSWVNECLQQKNQDPIFNLHLVGLSKTTTQTNKLFSIHPDSLIKDVKKTDLIILPAIHGDLEKNIKLNEEMIPWIIRQYNNGAEVVSLCIGSFFLASTGLLNGKQCSTHWQFANEFRKAFPEAILRDDKIMTEADGIYTSGGAYSFTNLLVYLIEKYAGREIAILASKAFMIDFDRSSQSPFIMFAGQKTHEDPEVLSAQEYIEKKFQERITVEELSEQFSVGRRTFERRFKKATSNTIVEYIQRVKIEAAKKQLEKGKKTVNEVMYNVGYADTKAFREIFKKITGMSPVDYKTRYKVA